MIKHTPSPWVATSNGISSEAPGVEGGIICDAPTYAPASMKYWPENARIMAAAPDLARTVAWLAGLLEAPLPPARSHAADGRRQEVGLALAAARAALKAAGVDEVEEQVRRAKPGACGYPLLKETPYG